jgi:hypothetical protein
MMRVCYSTPALRPYTRVRKKGKELLLLASFAIEQDIPRAMHGIESDAL